jgi:hypothetical protein
MATRFLKLNDTLKCDRCGATVKLYSHWANACDRCSAEYNGSGQRLAPRSQWGEETGDLGTFGSNRSDEAS